MRRRSVAAGGGDAVPPSRGAPVDETTRRRRRSDDTRRRARRRARGWRARAIARAAAGARAARRQRAPRSRTTARRRRGTLAWWRRREIGRGRRGESKGWRTRKVGREVGSQLVCVRLIIARPSTTLRPTRGEATNGRRTGAGDQVVGLSTDRTTTRPERSMATRGLLGGGQHLRAGAALSSHGEKRREEREDGSSENPRHECRAPRRSAGGEQQVSGLFLLDRKSVV